MIERGGTVDPVLKGKDKEMMAKGHAHVTSHVRKWFEDQAQEH